MSNVSIFGKNWIDLVFEGRNKAYGAYKLRQESPRTTLLAFFSGITFLSVLIFTLSSFSKSADSIDNPEYGTKIIVAGGHHPPIEEIKKTEKQAKKTAIKDDIKKEDIQNLVVAKKEENFSDIKTNEEAKKSTNIADTGSENGDGTFSAEGSATKTVGFDGNGESKEKSKVEITGVLDVQPEYPGGIKKFYEYVGNNFEKPSIDDVEKISVYVSFVIEKDGSMTDIKVLRNPGYGLDKEAIRVLKSLKTKWKPGVKDGQKVRTQYTLPITIQMTN